MRALVISEGGRLAIEDLPEGFDAARYVCSPPLRWRREGHQDALWEAVGNGRVDAVATDHAPHTATEKAVAFEQAPRGVIGLETAAAVASELIADSEELFRCLSIKPARIAGLEDQGRPLAPGVPANLVVFDPEERWLVREFRSRSDNSPYLGMTLTGRVRATLFRGRVSYLAGGWE